MRKALLFGSSVLVALTLAGPVYSQAPEPITIPPGTPTSTIVGTVVSSSSTELVIDTAAGQRRFIVDSRSSVPSGLAAGTRVEVEHHRLDNDRLHVARVTVASERPSPRADAMPRSDSDPATLPRTASPLGLIGLGGLTSLAGAVALRLRRA